VYYDSDASRRKDLELYQEVAKTPGIKLFRIFLKMPSKRHVNAHLLNAKTLQCLLDI